MSRRIPPPRKCDVYVRLLSGTLVILEAPCGADFVANKMIEDGYVARKLAEDLVLVQEVAK